MKWLKLNEKGQIGLGQLAPAVITLVIFFVIASIGATVSQTVTDEQCGTTLNASQLTGCNPDGLTVGYNASYTATQGFQPMSVFYGTLGLVLIAGVLLFAVRAIRA